MAADSFDVGTLHSTSPTLLADVIELLVLLGVEGRSRYLPAEMERYLTDLPDFDEKGDFEAKVLAAWDQLAYRAGRFDAAYPFKLNGQHFSVKSEWTPQTRIYRLLLVCSRLRSYAQPKRVAWAAVFTTLASHAVRQLMPAWATPRIFDAGSIDRQTHYGTNLRVALRKLAEDLALSKTTHPLIIDQQSTSGDAGIDLVVIAHFDDKADGTHALLAQCAARETDWPNKTLQASGIKFSAFFSPLHELTNVMCIPLLPRDTNGEWSNVHDIGGCLLLDRWRLIELVRKGTVADIVAQPWFTVFEKQLGAIQRPREPNAGRRPAATTKRLAVPAPQPRTAAAARRSR